MTAYRNDIDALAARDEVLARELAERQRERADVQRMLEEARAHEAADARERDVMVGRRRLRRIGLVAGALVATGVATGAGYYARSGDRSSPAVIDRAAAPRDEVRFGLLLAAKGLTLVELEPRFVAATGYDTLAELDAAIGEPVAAWQQFTYTRDAHARQAIASDVYRAGEPEPAPEFVSDGYGGVWRVTPAPPAPAPSTGRYARKLWLLPYGSVYRGDVEVE